MAEYTPFNAMLDPSKSGTLTGLIGGLIGMPTQSQAEGGAVGMAAQEISKLMAAGKTPQEAALTFFQTPAGQDFFANAGPQGMQQLTQNISQMTTPPPTTTNIAPGGVAVQTDQSGKEVRRFENPVARANQVTKPGDIIFGPTGNKVAENTNQDPTLLPADVRAFQYFQQFAQLPPDQLKKLATIKMDPTQADKSTAATQAIDEMIEKGQLDPRLGQSLKANAVKLMPLRDSLGIETGAYAIVDLTNPNASPMVINPRGNKAPNAPVPAEAAGNEPQGSVAVEGTSPSTGGRAGALPAVAPKTIPQKNPEYFGDKASMFLGSGVVPSVLSAASNVSEQLNPGMVVAEGAKAEDRKNLINQLRSAITGMGQMGEGLSVNKGTVESYLKMAPTGGATETPHQAVQKAIRLHEKITEEIAAERNVFKDGSNTPELRKAALKRADGWERVLRALPTYSELQNIEEAIRNGTAGAPTIAEGAKSVFEAGKKSLTEGKKQLKEVGVDTPAEKVDYMKLGPEELLAIDPRTLSREQNIQYQRAIDRMKKTLGKRSDVVPFPADRATPYPHSVGANNRIGIQRGGGGPNVIPIKRS